MRFLAVVPILVMELTALSTVPAAAQSVTRSSFAAGSIETPLVAEQRQGAAWHSRLLSAVATAAVGAGVGFFASQVLTGDWDEEPGHEVDRPAWAAVGGSIGFAVGFSFPLGGRGMAPRERVGLRGGRFELTADEISTRSGLNHALEIVQLFRPEWLNDRGVNYLASRDEGVVVYLDHSRLGNIEMLRTVSVATVRSMHYLDPGAATQRWGAGHSHGVILVIAAGGDRHDSR